jgi:hypothetical protein
MENDSVRSSGDLTLVEMWIDGKLRGISISRGAIEAFLRLPPDHAGAMTDEDRREFVRTHLSLVAGAAKDRLSHAFPEAKEITIDTGQLGERGGGRMGDRRRGDRRKSDRRKADQPTGRIGDRRQSERRRSDRRRSDRRTTPADPNDA